jgi:hypothetical protein
MRDYRLRPYETFDSHFSLVVASLSGLVSSIDAQINVTQGPPLIFSSATVDFASQSRMKPTQLDHSGLLLPTVLNINPLLTHTSTL